MKKLIGFVIVVGVVGGAFALLQRAQLQFSVLAGQMAKVTRGDLTVPITASGTIEPRRRAEIKSKASGTVIEIRFQPGDMVKGPDPAEVAAQRKAGLARGLGGEVLVRLSTEDEQRNVSIATIEKARATANEKKAQVTLDERKKTVPINVSMAKAKLASAKAALKQAKETWDRMQILRPSSPDPKTDYASFREYVMARWTYEESLAQRESMEANVESAEAGSLTIDLAEQDVKLANETLATAEMALAEANLRLSETEIRSPISGMVTRTRGGRIVEVGEVISSGKTSLTGGTALMEIADISELYVMAKVDESDIGRVLMLAKPDARPGPRGESALPTPKHNVVGRPVTIHVDAFPEDEFQGEIERILPEAERIGAVTRYDVRIRLTSDNRDMLQGVLGLQADVEFTSQSVENTLLVPYDAVKKDASLELGVYVAVPKENGTGFDERFRPCRFGLDDGLFVQVLEGVQEGETVYTVRPRKTQAQQKAERKDD